MRIVAPARLDVEAVQAEQPGIAAPRHRFKRARGAGAIAGKLRGLRSQEQRERLVRRDALRLFGKFARGARVARTNRDQPLRYREIAAHAASRAQVTCDQVGRADDGAEE